MRRRRGEELQEWMGEGLGGATNGSEEGWTYRRQCEEEEGLQEGM